MGRPYPTYACPAYRGKSSHSIRPSFRIDGDRKLIVRFLVDSGSNINCFRSESALYDISQSTDTLRGVTGSTTCPDGYSHGYLIGTDGRKIKNAGRLDFGKSKLVQGAPSDLLSVPYFVNTWVVTHQSKRTELSQT